MKPKKSKGGPGRVAAVRRRKGGLPPLVEGQLRCFLKLTVSKIVWMVAKPPASSLVRLRWWGETSNGTVFVPQDASQPEQKILNTTTCYPVRCGPKQFASYLTDMGALILEVMTKSDHLPIGRVQIKGLALLSPSHPISGFFPILSPSSEKMGELQISLCLEPLSDVYECNHTVHNTNTIKDAADLSPSLAPSQLHRPAGTHVHGRESLGSSRASTPRCVDLLDRGNRLRNAMAVSVMISNPDPVIERYEAQLPVKPSLSRQAGKTLKNSGLMCEDSFEPWRECSEFDLDAEKKAVELLLGSSDLSPDHLVDGASSPPGSLSPSSHLCDSELNDPHYDQSLLENLFYAAQEGEEAGKLSQPQGPKLQRSPKALESSPHRWKKKALEAKASRSPAKPLPGETIPETPDEIQAVNLSLDRLATLGRIRLARVVIETLRGVPPEDSAQSTPNQKSPSGKPPRPALAKKRTFFVECHFPVRTSKNGVGQTAVTTEMVRVASSRYSADGVRFQQRYVFPVHFSGPMITHWWTSPLDFNVFLKKGTQRKPALIGAAAFPLRDVLRSEDLIVSRDLPVKEDGVPGPLGPLQVSVELVAASKDISNIKASGVSPRAPVGSIRGQGTIFQDADRSPCSTRSPQSPCKAPVRIEAPLPSAFQRSPKDGAQPPVPRPVSRNLLTQMSAASEEEGMLLHVLLMVSEGQITPVALTSKHLERLKNNVMVIEYPVLAVDGPVPVVDVFSGQKNGSLKTILAMGSADQVLALQRVKKDEGPVSPAVLRPLHALDPLPAPPSELSSREQKGLVEHTFEVHIEGVQGLTPLQSTVWGEADCYVQYHFPVQKPESEALCDVELSEKDLELKAFRTSTTLCVPDPTFCDEHHHSLLVPADVPVQRLLLRAFSAQSLAGEGGGIHFEIWCRYYYPNVRDQMVARASLPLSRLCAMVTMQHRQEVGIQTFHLPVMPRIGSSGELHPRSSEIGKQDKEDTALAEKHPPFQYSAEIGLNTYVLIHLPFLPGAERRRTRTVARSFCPAFEHHVELPCRLVVQRSSGEACCLGELLQRSEVIFHLYHQPLNSAPRETLKDCLLGTVRVPTRDLLIRRSGLRGWYPLILPEDLLASRCVNVTQSIVGGLEISVAFARPGDRERVLETANRLGWNWKATYSEDPWEESESEGQTPSTLLMWLFLLLGCGCRYRACVFPCSALAAANLGGAALRVHITVTPAGPCGGSGNHEEDKDSSSSSVEEEKKAAEQELEVRSEANPSVDKVSQDKPAAGDLENTFAVSILVERAMHLSLKGNTPLAEQGVSSPCSYVSFVTTDVDNPITTSIVENTDSPIWEFQQQTRLSKELLLDTQKTLVFKIWHKADVERVIGFASVDLSPLLSGFQYICGWYNITDLSGQCRGQVKVAVSPLESITHLREERQARNCQVKTPESSLRTIPHFSFENLLCCADKTDYERQRIRILHSHPSPQEAAPNFQVLRGRVWKLPVMRGKTKPEGRVPLQRARAERPSVPHVAAASGGEDGPGGRARFPSLSSHTSLFRALRKNLDELDEIQRYFRAKLTRPLTDLSAPWNTTEGLDIQRPLSKGVNPEEDHLQKKPIHQTSQVGSQSVDRWIKMTSHPEGTSRGHEDGHRFSSADQTLRGQENGATRAQMLKACSSNEFWNARVGEEPVIDLRKSPSAEDMRYGFFDPTDSPKDPPSGFLPGIRREEDSAQSHSEEEYEEAIVEPRTLNEITTVTDKTSPWSSFLSEADQEPVHQAQTTKGGYRSPTERSLRRSSVSDVIPENPLSASSLTGSRNSPFGEEDGDNNAEEGLEADEPQLGAGEEEPQLGAGEEEPQLGGGEEEPQLGAGEEEPQLGAAEEPSTTGQVEIQKVGPRRSTEVQEGGPPGGSSTHNGGGDFMRARRVAPGVTEGRGNLPREPQQEEGTDRKGEEGHQLFPPSQEMVQQTEAFSGEDDNEDLAEEFHTPIIPLSEPITVPNFFLPPQHLEVSMRLLSASSSPLAAAHK
ncbi:hypothetical protein E2320_005662, partial [Naja naja]